MAENEQYDHGLGAPAPDFFATAAPPFGAPAPFPIVAAPGRSGLPVWAIVAICVPVALVVLGVLGAVAIPAFLNSRGMTVPETAGGLPLATDPEMTKRTGQFLTLARRQNPGKKVAVASYGTPGLGYLVIVTPRHVDLSGDIDDSLGVVTTTHFGPTRCASNSNSTAAFCMRSEGLVTVEVLAVGTTDVENTAAATDDVWRAQPAN